MEFLPVIKETRIMEVSSFAKCGSGRESGKGGAT